MTFLKGKTKKKSIKNKTQGAERARCFARREPGQVFQPGPAFPAAPGGTGCGDCPGGNAGRSRVHLLNEGPANTAGDAASPRRDGTEPALRGSTGGTGKDGPPPPPLSCLRRGRGSEAKRGGQGRPPPREEGFPGPAPPAAARRHGGE